MLAIPAIDLKNGRCVRLLQGQMSKEFVYSEDPIAMAVHWAEAGAERIHIVDLDGATSGQPENADIVHEIVKKIPKIKIQVGGGIRNETTLQGYMDAGVDYVVLGTRAIHSPEFVAEACTEFPDSIIVSLDAKNGRLATEGWAKLSSHNLQDMLRTIKKEVAAIIFTDINRDGTLAGNVDVRTIRSVCENTRIPVIAAGGVTNIKDIRSLYRIADKGLIGVIIGRALYEKTLDYAEAKELIDKLKGAR